jgi:hypothetical protein
MDSQLPRVAIAVPSGDMVHADFAMAYAQLCMASAGLQPQLMTVKSSIVAQARNSGVELARKAGADFIFFLDSDMLFPPTALFRLLLHRKDIVGATYTKRVAPFQILGSMLAEQPAVLSGDLLEMQRIPTGCLLINMGVFDKLSKPYFRFETDANGDIVGEDYVFCDRAREAGYRIWCDAVMSREIGHIGQTICRLPDAALHRTPLSEVIQGQPNGSQGHQSEAGDTSRQPCGLPRASSHPDDTDEKRCLAPTLV